MPQNNTRRGSDQRNSRDQDDFQFEIIQHFGVLSTSGRGWLKELNLVRFNGREPKFDLREWQPDHQKMSKGVTMTLAEVRELYRILEEHSDHFTDEMNVEENQDETA